MSDRFESAAAHYARHRPGYGDRAIEHLVERFDLDDGARVLDLGCGTGQIALPLSERAGEVVGVDPSAAMLAEARRGAAAAGREDVAWVRGSDAELDGLAGPFRLATMGRSFHWMDRERTLDGLHRVTQAGGGVAILGDPEWLSRGTEPWQDDVYAVADRYVDDLPDRTGPIEYDDPYDEVLGRAGFADVEVATFEVDREWTVDAAVGYVLSLSFCSPAVLGDDLRAFESDLRATLRERSDGPFPQAATVRVVSGRSP